ncbi:MAG: type II CRISPR-associated endonuclease Cas1 [Candidatus Saccharibacteria bacterium]|nr:type II CRISPR-associated endonuclease Cas1 [Candidatus Saccharibacteria bacterium]
MGWRVIIIENPAKLSLKDNKLVIEQEEKVNIPLEDIDSLVIDASGIVLTKNIITALSEKDVNVLFCDEKHLPCSTILPYSQASRGAKLARAQLNMSEPNRKQLWRKNIIQKITNQADVLKKFGYEHEDLRKLANTVRSGDTGNNESTAARFYFSRLLGDATRRKPMWHNSALNYGYAIIRSSIAREVAARGFISMIGINHHSELNQFNLVDDLIECFRPIVDDYVLSEVALNHINNADSSLSSEDRRAIIDILNKNDIIYNKKFEIKLSISKMVESFAKAVLEEDTGLFELPKVLI